jgi:predicted transcriptional regulator
MSKNVTVEDVLDKYSVSQGWNLVTQHILLIRFLDKNGLQNELEEFLKKIIAE